MFGDLLGNMEEKQKALKEKLAAIEITANGGDGLITVQGNANRQITNIQINAEAFASVDREELEDLLVITINRVLEQALENEAQAQQDLIKDMMPPGLGGLGNLFGQ